ncbi:PadR family transcriptional regulator [Streptomyces griseoviridis]|uniref:PadR family transcriptional regulator n=2 Tax=Streptomyces TaxID=1883 RepID=A0A3Q9KYM7_STRGD|nr:MULTISPECIES: PadR family transcriptional regulator [Streptomyces]AZS87663.1 PadR family transcriptional regulator [Streptomyces griseoviridis]MDH6698033.1 DNA-binding PadR family transcriptional regulator [Streptomyces sp. MAA16]MDT0471364.1 PadR family transcriptional regulator [Streptomyces sp. DSM 41014]QCN85489.1 PadR family transcriptional regulator [Streptomyces griseoviridis]
MPRRALDNPIVPAVLGLLLEQPSHPHQILADLRERSDHHAAAITRGTLYNTVAALAEAGWIASTGRERSGNRPERTVYALTDEGRHELVRRLDSQIRTPEREFSRFLGAVAHLGALGTRGAAEALAERARRLRQRTADDEERLARALAAGVPRLHVIEAEYALCLARAETAWIDSVIDDLRTGSLTSPTGPATSAPR